MLLGPFDRRKKRTRCQGCSVSHLKCSGRTPCNNCERRRITCTYETAPRKSPIILVERGKQSTISTWKTSPANKHHNKSPLNHKEIPSSSPCRLIDDSLCFLYYFDVFVRRNNFNGKNRTFGKDVEKLAGLHRGDYLIKSMLAIGAMQAVKLRAPDVPSRMSCLAAALEYYSKSIIGLRDAIDTHKTGEDDLRNTVLWTTLFLGLFELINDETGDGWQKHMIHGTAKALEASGAASYRSGQSRSFFMQARIFEVSRTILANEPTFLTEPQWVDLSRQMWTGQDVDEWRPLDSLLDIMVMISQLRVRAGGFVDDHADSTNNQPRATAESICADGFTLREALTSWYESYAQPNQASTQKSPSTTRHQSDQTPSAAALLTSDDDNSMLLSRIFFAAISIYLSGIFDYSTTLWQESCPILPTLDTLTIQNHTNTILQLSCIALQTTHLSPLLFLFPLRIAGARSREPWQRNCIMKLLGDIGSQFAAASAVRMELDQVWEADALDAPSEATWLEAKRLVDISS